MIGHTIYTNDNNTKSGGPCSPINHPTGTTRKRSRSRLGTFAPVAVAVAVFSAMVPAAAGFAVQDIIIRSSTAHRSQLFVLHVSAESRPRVRRQQQRRTATTTGYGGAAVATRVKPKEAISEEKRRQAIKAMNDDDAAHHKVDAALQGVDAQVLELLSEHFLYPGSLSASMEAAKARRPKGRPAFVPGAMNYETLVRFREKQEVLDIVGKNKQGQQQSSVVGDVDLTIAPYSTAADSIGLGATSSSTTSSKVSRTTKAFAVKGSSKKGVKGASSAATAAAAALNGIAQVGNAADVTDAPKRRKRVVKSLPSKAEKKRRSNGRNKMTRKRTKGNNLELHKYYRTELLGADEEYSLSMKVKFMVKCEDVHEGLSTSLMRLPSIEEWAEACGFAEEDPAYIPMEGDDQIRPAGSETMFEKTDPNKFVGNGLAHTAGPGRGRGRAKKIPPTKLDAFYDDSELKAAARAKTTTAPEKKMKDLEPINRGTVTNYIDMMLTAKEAKQRMVQCNMRLVVSIARKYSNVGVNLQDLVQEGSLGLSRAAEKFEPSKGFKFSTYASWWIQQAVFRSIAYHSRTIRLPVHVHNLLNRVRKVKNVLERDLGRPPSNDEMAESVGMTVEKYNKMLRLTRRSISLELPKYQSNPKDLGQESEDLLGDTIAATNDYVLDDSTPEKRVDRGLFQQDLNDMLGILDNDERRVICARYGLADGLTRTVTAVAAQMKESKSWVRSQECRALRKLRRPWYEKKLKEHQDALSN